MRLTKTLLAVLCALPLFAQATLNTETPSNLHNEEKGWFWGFWSEYVGQEELEEQEELSQNEEQEDEEIDCTDPEQWKSSCGFIDPGSSFEFQAAQRDELLKQAVMDPSDSNKVEQWQRYQRWVTDQALEMSKVWQWNLMQNQELNPTTATPIASFGIRAASTLKKGQRVSTLEAIKEQGGFLVWFTRSDCVFCHEMAEPLYYMKERNNIEMYAASLDGECIEFFKDSCQTGDLVIEAARHLAVQNVPDIWLHLPKDELWFRVSSGMESTSMILSRIELFFGAVTRAAEKGLSKAEGSERPAVDFSVKSLMEQSQGGLGRGVDNEK